MILIRQGKDLTSIMRVIVADNYLLILDIVCQEWKIYSDTFLRVFLSFYALTLEFLIVY